MRNILKFKNSNKFNTIGMNTAKISFSIGTLFFLIYLVTRALPIAFFGYFYLIAAVIVNLILLILLLVLPYFNKGDIIKNLRTIGIMLLNIPIAYLYAIIVIDYLN